MNDCLSGVMTAPPSDLAPLNGTIRVPGSYPPEWIPDQEADSCMACKSSFTLIKRRHHCRSCGKIFCGECCRLKAKLLYMDNKEARVCCDCYEIIEFTLRESGLPVNSSHSSNDNPRINEADIGFGSVPQGSLDNSQSIGSMQRNAKVQGVLKTSNLNSRSGISQDSCNTSSTSSEQHSNKQVIFSDGIRPGTDLSEPDPIPSSSTSETSVVTAPQALLTRQHRRFDGPSDSNRNSKGGSWTRNITVCDEIGYLPPIVICKDAFIMNPTSDIARNSTEVLTTTGSITSLILGHFKSSKNNLHASMESRSCPLNGIVKFHEIADFVGIDGVVTFLLLKDLELKVKIVKKDCCIDKGNNQKHLNLACLAPIGLDNDESEDTRCMSLHDETQGQLDTSSPSPVADDLQEYWCFLSNGLEKLGQDEVLLVTDKNKDDSCIPRDVFKIYLTLHELALRKQALEHLGNLLFQDGLFGHKDTAGLLLVKPMADICLDNLVLPGGNRSFLIALVLQRWEVPWSKIFPMRLLLRLGYMYNVYPHPVVSFKTRDPVYYEIGHTIISILGDFRNFRYSLTHVDGLRVTLNKTTRKVLVRLAQSNYQRFNKVLDSANNEHVLAWSSSPIPETDGHLVCVQNDDGQYETVEFLNEKSKNIQTNSLTTIESGINLGVSFIVFSGALKVNQTGQPAKISVVEDGLLIQIQSCTMSALKNAIHFMHDFDIDCENSQELLNRVEINWRDD